MLAKEPEKRYADYDRLIEALDAVGRGGTDRAKDIPLVPLEDEEPPILPEASPSEDRDAPLVDEPAVFSLELSDERDPGDRRTALVKADVPLPRLGLETGPMGLDDALEEEDVEEIVELPASAPFPSWTLATVGAGVLAFLLVVGLHVMLGGPGPADTTPIEIPAPENDTRRVHTFERTVRPPPRPDVRGQITRKPPPTPPPPTSPPPTWPEPEDRDTVAGDLAPLPSEVRDAGSHLPDWARSAPAPPEEKSVVVRRLAGPDDGTTEPTLLDALDRYVTGLVELADVGPLTPDDLHVSGESRWIKARRGYRPVLWIQRSRLRRAMEQPAFVMLRGGGSKGKSLVIEGVDIIINAHDLSGNQKALFGCAGADLTLRDCTVTVINPPHAPHPPFALVREVPLSSSEAPRRSHIRLERTLVRGNSIALADLDGGSADLVIDASAVLVAGPGRPLIRVVDGEGAEPHRIFFAGALVSCSGPLIHRDHPDGAPTRGKPPIVRADRSAFGRVSGDGILSIATSSDDATPPARELVWSGESNYYVGWKGFFAQGKNPQITVDGLGQARSTWNAGEQGSTWIMLLAWALPGGDPAFLVADAMAPLLPVGRHALMDGPAQPSLALFAKTFGSFPALMIPEPPSPPDARQGPGAEGRVRVNHPADPRSLPTPPREATLGSAAVEELVMKTSDFRWGGDLGAFLRESIPPGTRSARVRVIGSGAHPFTPVRLPDGMGLDLFVERDSPGAPPPSWSPAPQSRGPALIELRGGALSFHNLHLRQDPSSAVERLIVVEGAHLVLSRCRLDVPPEPGSPAGDLIVFRAPTTQPMPGPPGISAFGVPIDRPVCRLIDTVLVADRTALAPRWAGACSP